MSATLDIAQLRSDIRLHCGVSSTDAGFDDDGCDLLANRSLWAIINLYPFREKEKTSTFSTIIGTDSYALPTLFEAIKHVSIEDISSQEHSILTKMTPLEYENVFVNNSTAYGKPTRYLREGSCLKLYATPDNVYPITVKHWITLAQLDDSNPNFPYPPNWYEIVMYGASERGFAILRQFDNIDKFHNLQSTAISGAEPIEAKENKDTSYAGFMVHGYDPNRIYE